MSSTESQLVIKNLHVTVNGREIIKGVNLEINAGTLHVVMGPNGSGKSTLTYALLGHPSYIVTRGMARLNGKNLLELKTFERARLGLLLAFQNPMAVAGVTLSNFLRIAYRQMHPNATFSILDFHKQLLEKMQQLNINPEFTKRGINDGFSGGEKKKVEMLQLMLLQPKIAVFDEIDTGLDVDALKTVASGITSLKATGCGILLITHYQRILNHISVDKVHIMKQGELVAAGGQELISQIEEKGYDSIHRP